MREGFIIHPEDVLPLRPHMSTENFGELLIALCLFAIGETPSEMAPPVGTAYAFLTSRIQRELEAYDKKAARNRINGRRHIGNKKPDDPNTTHSKPEEPSEGEAEPRQGLPNPIPNPNPVTKKDISALDTPYNASAAQICLKSDDYPAGCPPDTSASAPSSEDRKAAEAEALFSLLWEQYPNKKGKGRVSAAKKRELLDIGKDEMLRALHRYIDEHNTKKRLGDFTPPWQNGSTFLNSGYVDYLDENYVPAPHEPPATGPSRSGFLNYKQSDTDWDAVCDQIMFKQEEDEKERQEKG